jgi:hypothetical protein
MKTAYASAAATNSKSTDNSRTKIRTPVERREAEPLVTVRVLMNKLILAVVLKASGFRLCRMLRMKMNFIFNLPDAILTLHVAEAHR